MDFLQSLLDSSSVPAITAFILGILTAVSPCPLATNITAIGFISKDIENRHRIFINGLLYTFGRIVTYTVLGFILIPILREGASMFMVQKAVSKYGEMLIAPVLIIIGIFMLDIIKLNLPKINIGGESLKKKTKGGWGAMFIRRNILIRFRTPRQGYRRALHRLPSLYFIHGNPHGGELQRGHEGERPARRYRDCKRGTGADER